MENPFIERMRGNSDGELVRIITVAKGDYQDMAVTAAQNELESRNIAPEKFENLLAHYQEERVITDKKSNEPLDNIYKVIGVLLPFVGVVILMVLYMSLERKGYRRKASEIVKWSALGIGIYMLLFILIFSLL